MSSKQHAQRRTVFFTGHVQGVGFRYTARNVARSYEVTGYVRNCPDGRVEMVAEGSEDELARFVQGVEAAMAGHIRDRRSSTGPASGEFPGFEVRY